MRGAGGSATGRLAELTCLCNACRSRVAFGNVVISTPGNYLFRENMLFFPLPCLEGGCETIAAREAACHRQALGTHHRLGVPESIESNTIKPRVMAMCVFWNPGDHCRKVRRECLRYTRPNGQDASCRLSQTLAGTGFMSSDQSERGKPQPGRRNNYGGISRLMTL
jgi:hypothetical protein